MLRFGKLSKYASEHSINARTAERCSCRVVIRSAAVCYSPNERRSSDREILLAANRHQPSDKKHNAGEQEEAVEVGLSLRFINVRQVQHMMIDDAFDQIEQTQPRKKSAPTKTLPSHGRCVRRAAFHGA